MKVTRFPLWQVALLAVVAVIAYLPALRAGFIWDDDALLTQNPLIPASDGLRRFWFTTEAVDYWPATMTTFWMEWRIWALHAAGYHVTNLLLHIVESLLIWDVLGRLRIPGAFVGALLFAVHPVNVESVAWIAERKNLMAMLFFLLSVRFFLRSQEAVADGTRNARSVPLPNPDGSGTGTLTGFRPGWYCASLAAFLLALLSKGSVAVLPLVLTGIILSHRKPARRDILRLVPFYLLGVAFAAIDVIYQSHHVSDVIRVAGPLERLLGAGAIAWFYLFKAILPLGLSFVYPSWHIDVSNFGWWMPLLMAVAATIGLGIAAAKHPGFRPACYAWDYFGIALIPVLGFVDVYFMKYSLVADHYQHLALIGVTALGGWAWHRWRAWNSGWLPVGVLSALVAAMAGLTFSQCLKYRDSETLFRSVLRDNPQSSMAHINLGMIELHSGREGDAQADFTAALRSEPGNPEAHHDLGITLLHARRNQDAAAQFAEAVRLKPRFPEAHNAWALALLNLGRPQDAVTQGQEAIRLRPTFAEARNNLGLAFAALGQMNEAIGQFEAAIEIRPSYVNARENLGGALADQSKFVEAQAQFMAVIHAEPNRPEGYVDMGRCLLQQGRNPEALSFLQTALRIDPVNAGARELLAAAQQPPSR